MCNRTRWFSVANNNFRCCVTEAADIKYNTYVSIIFASSIVFLVLSPVAVVGNALILAAIWKRTFQRTWLHLLLSGLAFSDFCTGLIVQPLLGLLFFLFLDESGVVDAQKHLNAYIVTYVGLMSETFFSKVESILLTLLSIERWLHMSRRSLMMTPHRRCLAVTLLLVVPAFFVVSNVVQYLRRGRLSVALTIINFVVIVLCYLITSFAYYKLYRIIRQHQQQVQGNQSSQNFGQPAINLAKYKRSVKSMLYIFALFSVTLTPVVVGMAFLLSRAENLSCLEASAVFYVSLSICFLSSCLNPAIYLWRMNEVREGVKSLFCAND
ncbi:high-affinity lysophosphatidic acid receptor-like [Montipora foliosa]|uniref:high-affinity lysophosphatidic acid receptor-like n=1 Tax=Montipora foliosa TaxID=591990 RepID=UPI0035F1DE43